ncbi:MAG TPA: prephenate dehydrogenase/arogenate dehydrogenase family protein [Terracidiphilus sp.]|nr:prephenate dehydrogenase/arogenate dehydrogenase family protein [Terracidiphilus sp.]
MPIQQITIVGTGLIGGSFALAVKKHGFTGRIVGCDREPVLAQAKRAGVIDEGIGDPVQASRGSQVVLLATPVGAILDLIERIGPTLSEGTLLTDVGGTKSEVAARAQSVFGSNAATRFLPGHPMAGKERSGIEQADGDLFNNAVWLVTPLAGQNIEAGLSGEFLKLVRGIGARVVSLDLARHDRLCAWISHLPQMLSTALAATVLDELGDDPEFLAIGGRALREMTRIASSPYSMWRDIALTNTGNIEEALSKLEQRLAHIRENLRTPELKAEFERGNRFRHGDTEDIG